MTTKRTTYKAGDFVIVEHGASKRGQVAVVESVPEGLVEVRSFHAGGAGADGLPGTFAKHTKRLPLRLIRGIAPEDDPRTEPARIAYQLRQAESEESSDGEESPGSDPGAGDENEVAAQ